MSSLGRLLGCAAMGLTVGVCGLAAADYPRSDWQTSAGDWPESAEAARPADRRVEVYPTEPLRLLPTRYQASETLSPEAAATEPSAQRPITASATPRSLPLTQKADDSPASSLVPGDFPPLATGVASLGIVLGLFLAVAWVVRRGMPGGAGLLPIEAVEVLGRAPLAGRHQAYLVRCGNKLVLLNLTQAGVEPLTEISDPQEVERLQAICRAPSAGARTLRQFFGRFGASQQRWEYPAVEQPAALDFRHLELDNRRQA